MGRLTTQHADNDVDPVTVETPLEAFSQIGKSFLVARSLHQLQRMPDQRVRT